MTLSRLLRIVPALLIVASPLVVPACAAATDSEAESLRGISGVYVLVENLSDEARRDGLNEQDIQTDVGLKLRLAGVKVLTEAEDFEAPGSPYLYVNVSTMSHDDLSLVAAYCEHVSLRQYVLLDRDRSIRLRATTWSTGGIGMVGRRKLSEIRGDIKDDADKFLNAYLSVNPKK